MGLIDWLIVIIPVIFVIGMGLYSRKYVRSVAEAGRSHTCLFQSGSDLMLNYCLN